MQRRSTALTLFLAITSCYLAADEKAKADALAKAKLAADEKAKTDALAKAKLAADENTGELFMPETRMLMILDR